MVEVGVGVEGTETLQAPGGLLSHQRHGACVQGNAHTRPLLCRKQQLYSITFVWGDKLYMAAYTLERQVKTARRKFPGYHTLAPSGRWSGRVRGTPHHPRQQQQQQPPPLQREHRSCQCGRATAPGEKKKTTTRWRAWTQWW